MLAADEDPCECPGSYPSKRDSPMTTFKAMTWNVENLFRPAPGANEEEGRRFRRKLELLAGVIGRLDPDVVALQEVGGEEPSLTSRRPSAGPTRTARSPRFRPPWH